VNRDKLVEILGRSLGTVAAGATSVGFVAFVGGAIMWARFSGAGIPPADAISHVDRGRLLATGGAALVFVVPVAVVALVFLYLADGCGRASRETRWGLVTLMALGGLAAILAADLSTTATLIAVVVAALAAMALGWLADVIADFVAVWSQRSDRSAGALARAVGRRLFGAANGARGKVVLVVAGLAFVGGLRLLLEDDDGARLLAALLGAAAVALHPLARPWRSRDRLTLAASVVLVYVAIATLVLNAWLAAAAACVLVLGAIALGVAKLTRERFFWYGVTVFASVAVFVGFLEYAHTRERPQVQAAAALLGDTQAGVCGLYVGETDERLYLARVDLRPGTADDRKPRPGTGRVFWLARERVVASAAGPLQTVGAAQENAATLLEGLVEERRALSRAPGPEPAPAAAPAGAAPRTEPTPAAIRTEPARARSDDPCLSAPEPVPVRLSPDRTLAERFQPTVVLDRDDLFWPVSVLTVFRLRHESRRTCHRVFEGVCPRVRRPGDLPWAGGRGEWLEHPAPNADKRAQHRDVVEALGSPDPAASARLYFLVKREPRLTTIQYWLYYPFNYIAFKGIADVGYHEADFENLGILLGADGEPAYLWMSRHGESEGRRFPWAAFRPVESPGNAPRRNGDHPVVYAARGSHALYESCGLQVRLVAKRFADDRVPCGVPEQLVLEPSVTPLSDLSYASWGCWHGAFGHVVAKRRIPGSEHYLGDAPLSPLWQQPGGARPCERVRRAPARHGSGEEALTGDTPAILRANAGSLRGRFDDCADWRQPPAAGTYVSVCERDALRRHFAAGLRGDGPGGLRARVDGEATAPTVPLVLSRRDRPCFSRVEVAAARRASPEVYVACASGSSLLSACFDGVTAGPGQPVRIVRTGTSWTLRGEPGGPRSVRPARGMAKPRCARRPSR
jgi:hypothetical protein